MKHSLGFSSRVGWGLCAAVLACLSAPAGAEVRVVTSLPDLAWATRQIGGSQVKVRSLLVGTENPHFVDARPDLVLAASNADLVCQVGLELEIGWMPKVLSRSGNARVQSGGAGFCEVGKRVELLQKPTGNVDRSMGDIHPFGNPHFWLSPTALGQAAQEIRDALTRVDPEHAAQYTQGYLALVEQLKSIRDENAKRLQAARGLSKNSQALMVVEYHREFVYWLKDYGVQSVGSIEEKPGVPPSAGRLGEVSRSAKAAQVRLALAAEYSPSSILEKFHELSGIEVVVLPTSSRTDSDPRDYPALQKEIMSRVVAGLSKSGAH